MSFNASSEHFSSELVTVRLRRSMLQRRVVPQRRSIVFFPRRKCPPMVIPGYQTSSLCVRRLDLKCCRRQLVGLGLHSSLDAQTRQDATDHSTRKEQMRLSPRHSFCRTRHAHARERAELVVCEHEDALLDQLVHPACLVTDRIAISKDVKRVQRTRWFVFKLSICFLYSTPQRSLQINLMTSRWSVNRGLSRENRSHRPCPTLKPSRSSRTYTLSRYISVSGWPSDAKGYGD